MPAPYCTILAGPNGSGKSSFFEALRPTGEFVNVDNIARDLPDEVDGPARNIRAGRIAIQRIRDLIVSKTSFVFETTLSSRHSTRLMRQAKDAGFEVGLVYVTLDKPQRNVERVAFRVADGGHDIPRHDILRRYEASLSNLTEALRLADKVVIADNSSVHPVVVFEIAHATVLTSCIDQKSLLHERFRLKVCEAYGLAL